ncbi:tetrahydrobiopterin biosynthesis enzymes-like protein [Aspergillus steynii IBT 23096]|uniref:dihydroneopterin aldolase n=1 Tax=Aspergillus steynii IBT 23096 TaxID=1392250 RepID=A0A2I2FV22_9EURO|nr:tetrahydrobiopterin biosynthesis enzymes-like protein [Aspergillus steynii IBT 23096]PLB44416.1 tetrahydrobiopterin biosynthesis enzymes-like protein [Aspergillus steynii IBT 23096]
MGECKSTFQIPLAPPLVDHICLRNVQLPLPCAPEAWHRPCLPQPCTMSLRLSCCSIMASAADDDVSQSLDYGKLYRRIEELVRHWPIVHAGYPSPILQWCRALPSVDPGQDIASLAGRIASLALGYLKETAREIHANRPGAIQQEFGQCEVDLHLPKALLRAEQGLWYRCHASLGRSPEGAEAAVVTGEEFRIRNIRCHCLIGINPHERLEKQVVVVSLKFQSPGAHFLDMYQEMTRVVAEEVDQTAFQSVEALVTFVARIVTVRFGNDVVTVRVEKPNALAFAEGTGVEVTRSRSFFTEEV